MGRIYLVRCGVNGKGYTGKTMHEMEGRKYAHEWAAKKGSKLPFHCALRKHGFENFEWSIVFDDVDENELNEFERVVIRNMGTKAPNGYNLTDGGDGGPVRLGMKNTLEAKLKLSKSMMGNTNGLGKPCSAERKIKISRANKGRKWSEESRRRASVERKGRPCPMKGKKHTEETRRKMSESRRGKKRGSPSEQTRKKISKSNTGKRHSAEVRAKMSRSHEGVWLSLERRKRMSESMKKWWAKRKSEKACLLNESS